jgi:hypothetical protein
MNTVLFFLITVLLLALPFLPALRELLRPRDVEPLRVASSSEVEIRRFAEGCRHLVNETLSDQLAACEKQGREIRTSLEDGGEARILPAGSTVAMAEEDGSIGYTQELLLSPGSLSLPPEKSFLGEIVAKGDLRSGRGDIIRAALAEGDIALAAGSVSLRWLHADGELSAEEDCALYGRVSADGAIRLSPFNRFERLNAPRILSAEAEDPPPAPQMKERKELDPKKLPGFQELAGGRCLVKGNLELPAHSRLACDLVVTGALRVGEDTEIDGRVKARRALHLEPGVTVTGALVSGRELETEAHCILAGPVLAEGDLILGSCCRVGSMEEPTTVLAEHSRLRPGVIIHGSLRARDWGEVLPPATGRTEQDKKEAADA